MKLWQHERDSFTAHCRSLKSKTQRCQNAVISFEVQVAQIPRLTGMLNVGRQTSNTLRADVLRLRAENLQFSQSKRLRCGVDVFGRNPAWICCHSKWRTGTDVIPFVEEVELSSFADAGGRLPVHLNSFFSTACPEDPQATPKSLNVPVQEPERSVNDSASKKEEHETLDFDTLPNFDQLPDLTNDFSGVKYHRVQVVRLKQWYGST